MSIHNIVPYERLAAHPFFQGMEQAEVVSLTQCVRIESFTEGDYVFREGARADALYLVEGGRVALEVQIPGSGATRVETLEAGDILGLHWLFPPYRWALDAHVVQAVSMVVLDATMLRAKLEGDPKLGYAVTSRMLAQAYKRLERLRLQYLDVYRGDG
jgi:CRP/FNR family transcriptional regulator, cyclic AMP receptor protein